MFEECGFEECKWKYIEWIVIDVRGSKGLFEERSVKERKKSSLEELLSEGGKDDMSVTPVIGVDCEMVEVVGGESALGRVSVVNYYGYVFVIDWMRLRCYMIVLWNHKAK